MARTARGGFSLVEVQVALVMFSAFFLLVMSVWPVHARAARLGRDYMLAAHIAEREMEQCLLAGFSAVASRSGTSTVATASNGVDLSVDFAYQVVVSDVDADTRSVVVTVEWQEGGVTRDVRYETLFCET